MAYAIGSDCISCGACAGVCPVECITPGDEAYIIDADQCISCGTCADTCPVSTITGE